MLCSQAFRSSVLSNVPPAEHGKEGGIRAVAHAHGGARPAGWGDGPSGRGQFARVILTGCGLDAGAGGARRAGTSPELEPGTLLLRGIARCVIQSWSNARNARLRAWNRPGSVGEHSRAWGRRRPSRSSDMWVTRSRSRGASHVQSSASVPRRRSGSRSSLSGAATLGPRTGAVSSRSGTSPPSLSARSSRPRRPSSQTSSPLRASYLVPSLATASYQEAMPD